MDTPRFYLSYSRFDPIMVINTPYSQHLKKNMEFIKISNLAL